TVAAIGSVIFFSMRGAKPMDTKPAVAALPDIIQAGPPVGGKWIEDWADSKRGRKISVLSGSMPLTDFRAEFLAQIESKSVGWVYRGLNPRNFYVAKIETLKAGLEPTVALVHFAVIDGRDQSRVERPLPMPVRVDTVYKVKFEAVGNKFTTWIQDQKVDEWTDNRLGSGGVGLFFDKGETAVVQ